MPENALVPIQTSLPAQQTISSVPMNNMSAPTLQFTKEQRELIKKTVMIVAVKEPLRSRPDAAITDDELEFFLMNCIRTGLDPITKQIYGMKRYDDTLGGFRLTIEIGIDGFRLIALRNPKYDGQSAPQWCGHDGKWRDLWLEDTPPIAARVLIYRKDISHPFFGLALWKESKKNTKFWSDRGASQLAKCAEVNGFRRAFPQDFSGIYIPDEMPSTPVGTQIAENIPLLESDATIMAPAPQPLMLNGPVTQNHGIVGDEYEVKEVLRLREEIKGFMVTNSIPPTIVQKIARDLGIDKPSNEMNSGELNRVLLKLKECQASLERQLKESAAIEQPQKDEKAPGVDEPLAPFTPPENPFNEPTIEDKPAMADEQKKN